MSDTATVKVGYPDFVIARRQYLRRIPVVLPSALYRGAQIERNGNAGGSRVGNRIERRAGIYRSRCRLHKIYAVRKLYIHRTGRGNVVRSVDDHVLHRISGFESARL